MVNFNCKWLLLNTRFCVWLYEKETLKDAGSRIKQGQTLGNNFIKIVYFVTFQIFEHPLHSKNVNHIRLWRPCNCHEFIEHMNGSGTVKSLFSPQTSNSKVNFKRLIKCIEDRILFLSGTSIYGHILVLLCDGTFLFCDGAFFYMMVLLYYVMLRLYYKMVPFFYHLCDGATKNRIFK